MASRPSRWRHIAIRAVGALIAYWRCRREGSASDGVQGVPSLMSDNGGCITSRWLKEKVAEQYLENASFAKSIDSRYFDCVMRMARHKFRSDKMVTNIPQ